MGPCRVWAAGKRNDWPRQRPGTREARPGAAATAAAAAVFFAADAAAERSLIIA